MEYNGIINLYKEKGMSSFKVVSIIRKLFGIKKVGHTGTLDPLAEGVLPICIGKATRASNYIMDLKKVYKCEMQFGYETDTLDLEGKIVERSLEKQFKEARIIKVLDTFIGKTKQLPPMYSAIKINGKKLYQYARNNEKIEIKERDIVIHKIDIEQIDNDKLTIIVECEKGTYIRSLCRDVGHKLNTYATMTKLIRISTGAFVASKAYKLSDIEKYIEEGLENNIIEAPEKYITLPSIILDEKLSNKYILGQKIPFLKKEGEYLVKDYKKETIGIGIINEKGQLKSKKRLK